MPSPIGHALGGIAAGWLIQGRGSARPWIERALIFGLLGMLPDVDLLFGLHSMYTHSVCAVAIVGLAAWLLTAQARLIVALAAAAAYGSHILLDWLGTDTTPPIGIMALWPLSGAFYESPLHVFMAISRRYWLPEFWTYNLKAVAREALILGPIVWIVWISTGRTRGRSSGPDARR